MINILRQVFHITHSSYNHFMKNTLEALNKFFGAVIALNIIHQIISSAGYFPLDLSNTQDTLSDFHKHFCN